MAKRVLIVIFLKQIKNLIKQTILSIFKLSENIVYQTLLDILDILIEVERENTVRLLIRRVKCEQYISQDR